MSGNFRTSAYPFTMVNNEVVEDKTLSLKAKGLYLIIRHYITIPNFTLNKSYLMSLSKEGEKAFDSTWKELKEAGYLKQYRLKGSDGKWVYEYELLDKAVKETTEEVKNRQIKKPPTSAKVDSYNQKAKSSKPVKSKSNNSIQQNQEKYTDKSKKDTGKTYQTKNRNGLNAVNKTFDKYGNELEEVLKDNQKDKFDNNIKPVTKKKLIVLNIDDVVSESEIYFNELLEKGYINEFGLVEKYIEIEV